MDRNSNNKKAYWCDMSTSKILCQIEDNLFNNSRLQEKSKGIELVPFRRDLIPDMVKWNCLYGIPGYK